MASTPCRGRLNIRFDPTMREIKIFREEGMPVSYKNPARRFSSIARPPGPAGVSRICERCRDLDGDQRKVLKGMIEELLELDGGERNAFSELLSENGYGSISLVFKAGECIGLDWQSSHRTHEL